MKYVSTKLVVTTKKGIRGVIKKRNLFLIKSVKLKNLLSGILFANSKFTKTIKTKTKNNSQKLTALMT